MRKLFWIFLLAGFTTGAPLVQAESAIRNVQIQLKNRGFYYGSVDGVSGSETEAALRRFQIRNGLAVTGTMTEETSKALNRPPSASAPRVGGGREETEVAPSDFSESDQQFLQSNPRPSQANSDPTPQPAPSYITREERRDEHYSGRLDQSARDYDTRDGDDRPGYVPPPVSIPLPYGGGAYDEILLGTIYEDASRKEQRGIVQEAQYRLARLRYYHGEIDGLPGPETEAALAEFQDDGRRRVTGRLDMATLDDLGLLERRRRSPSISFGIRFGDNRVYRGIQISR